MILVLIKIFYLISNAFLLPAMRNERYKNTELDETGEERVNKRGPWRRVGVRW